MEKVNKSKSLNLALAVGLVVTNLVTVVPAYGAGATENIAKNAIMSTRSPQIDETRATFDKKTPEDVSVTITSENTLKAVKNGSKKLKLGTEYTVTDDVVTIKKEYLSTLTDGTRTLKFDFDNGSDPSLKIRITDTSAKISSSKATFNNKYGRGKDISVRLTTNDNEFLGITDTTTGTELVEDTDYTVSTDGKKVTIKKEYLDDQPTGTTKLAFSFDAGTSPVLAVKVIDDGTVATIKSVATVAVETTVGNAPVLPTKVTATLSDGTTKTVAVTWGTVDATEYAAVGTFDVSGTIAGTTVKAKATVSVVPVEETVAVASVDASVNGTLKVTLTKAPDVVPAIADFTVKAAGAAVTPTAISTTGSVVTLTVPTVVATTAAQTVVYSVAYKTTAAVTGTLVVQPVGGLVSSVSPINDTTVQVVFNGALSSVSASDFTINNGLTVYAAKLGADNKTVTLTVTRQTAGTVYTVSYKFAVVGTFIGLNPIPSEIPVTPASDAVNYRSEYNSTGDALVRGRHTYTVDLGSLTGKVNIALVDMDNVTSSSNGWVFKDANKDLLADESTIGKTKAEIVLVNNVAPVEYSDDFVTGVTIPADGKITIVVDSDAAPVHVRPVVWQDTNANKKLDVDTNGISKEKIGVGGVIAWTGPEAVFNSYSVQAGMVRTGQDLLTDTSADVNNKRFEYDANDTFKLLGVPVSMAQFESKLTDGDSLNISYNPDPSLVSIFDITEEGEWKAPSLDGVTVVNGDQGIKANDVNVIFTPDEKNLPGTKYVIQRAPIVGDDGIPNTPDDLKFGDEFNWETVATIAANPDSEGKTTYTDFNVPDGRYVYRVYIQNDVSGTIYPNITTAGNFDASTVSVPGAPDVDRPEVVWSSAKDNGKAGQLDAGDKLYLLFNEPMKIAAGNEIQVQDGDSEYAKIFLGQGNTFTTTLVGDQTLLEIDLTATPAVAGDNDTNGIGNQDNDNVIEYDFFNDTKGIYGLWLNDSLGITDSEGNSPELSKTVYANQDNIIERDITNVSVVSVSAKNGERTFSLTFSEPIDRAAATAIGNYRVYDQYTNFDNPITNVVVSEEPKPINGAGIADAYLTVKFTVLNPLTDLSTIDFKVADLAGNNIQQTKQLVGINKPTLTFVTEPNAWTQDKSPLFAGNVTDADGTVTNLKVSFNGGAWTDLNDQSLINANITGLGTNNVSWSYAPNAPLADGDYTFQFRAIDNDDNVTDSPLKTVYIRTSALQTRLTESNTPVDLDDTDAALDTTVSLVFSDPIDETTVDAADFAVNAGASIKGAPVVSADKKTIDVVVSNATLGTVLTMRDGAVRDLAGLTNTSAVNYTIVDKNLPVLNTVAAADKTVILTFSEPVKGNQLLSTDDFTVSDDLGNVYNVAVAGFSVNGAATDPASYLATRTLTLSEGVDPLAKEITVKIKATENNVVDQSNNFLADSEKVGEVSASVVTPAEYAAAVTTYNTNLANELAANQNSFLFGEMDPVAKTITFNSLPTLSSSILPASGGTGIFATLKALGVTAIQIGDSSWTIDHVTPNYTAVKNGIMTYFASHGIVTGTKVTLTVTDTTTVPGKVIVLTITYTIVNNI